MKAAEGTPLVPTSLRARLGRCAREPLLHFLLLGSALFLVLDDDSQAQPPVTVGAAQQAALQAKFTSSWRRAPDAAELAGLIDDYVREELAVREALALGIDRDDAVIRRLLRMKMEFLATDAVVQEQPSDAQLQEYLDRHAEQFRLPAQYRLQQVYLDPMRHGDDLQPIAEALLQQLEALTLEQVAAQKLGDASQLPTVMDALSHDELAKRLGNEFADSLGALPVGRWSGPVSSGYGVHLVYVQEVVLGALPSLAHVRQHVLREWSNAQREEALLAFYAEMRQRYGVQIEPADGAPSS